MRGSSVLIAGFSGRALAQAARRAGYIPLVVDAFGDDDMRSAAADCRVIETAMRSGFRAPSLIEALDCLVASAPTPPIGLVVSSGFEATPRLLAALDKRYGLIGTAPDVVARIKDPLGFAQLCADLAIAHPATLLAKPDDESRWLTKERGGSGGTHIRNLDDRQPPTRRRYYQKFIGGQSMSLFAIIGDGRAMSAPTVQWTAPSPRSPFRYGGAATLDHHPMLQAMEDVVAKFCSAIKLRGMVSFDFRTVDDKAYLLEVNPRPGATLDLFDSDSAPLFESHVASSHEGNSLGLESIERLRPPLVGNERASAILYHAGDAFVMPTLDWPVWTADRTPAGTKILPRQPIATITAAAPTTTAAMTAVAQRLVTFESLLYDDPSKTSHRRQSLC